MGHRSTDNKPIKPKPIAITLQAWKEINHQITINVIEASLLITTDLKVFDASAGCLMLSCDAAALKLVQKLRLRVQLRVWAGCIHLNQQLCQRNATHCTVLAAVSNIRVWPVTKKITCTIRLHGRIHTPLTVHWQRYGMAWYTRV